MIAGGGCVTSKRPFPSQEAAVQRLAELCRPGVEHPKGYAPKRAYECPWCGGWHLTHLDGAAAPPRLW